MLSLPPPPTHHTTLQEQASLYLSKGISKEEVREVAFITVLADEWLLNGANLNDNKKTCSSYLLFFYATSINIK